MCKPANATISLFRQRILKAIDEAENKGDWVPLLATFSEEHMDMVNIPRLIPNLPALARSDYIDADDKVASVICEYLSRQREGFFVAINWMEKTRIAVELCRAEQRRVKEEVRRAMADIFRKIQEAIAEQEADERWDIVTTKRTKHMSGLSDSSMNTDHPRTSKRKRAETSTLASSLGEEEDNPRFKVNSFLQICEKF